MTDVTVEQPAKAAAQSAGRPWGDFLRLFHGYSHWPLIAINKATKHLVAKSFPSGANQASDAREWAAKHNADGYDLYFAINPTIGPLKTKASKADVLEARWVWVDCDPPDDLNDSDLEAWKFAKLAELQTGKDGVPAPAIIIDSGRGLWAFWALTTAAPVDGNGPLTKKVESVLRALRNAFDGDPNCHNIDRIARLPGFVNHKTGQKARALQFDTDTRFELSDFPAAPQIASEARATAVGTPEPYRELHDDDDAKRAVRAFLASAPAAIERRGGRGTTMTVLQRCQDLGCTFETSIELMMESWNDRCEPPWDFEEIAYELRGLERNDPIGCDHPAIVAKDRAKLAAMFFEPPEEESITVSAQDASLGSNGARRVSRLKFHGDPDETPLKKWLLDKTLPEAGVGLLSGQSGTYKTFLAFDITAAVITKGTFAGRKVRRQGGVFFIAAEGQQDVRSRLKAIVTEKVHPALAVPSDERLPLDIEDLPFAWDEECPSLTAPGAYNELRDTVQDAADRMIARTGVPLAMIIIDTMMSAAGFGNANDSAEAQTVMNLLRKIAIVFEVLVLVVDHMGKDQSKGTAGAHSKEASADAVLAVLGDRILEGKVSNVRLAFRKVRGGRQGDSVPFGTRVVNVGIDSEGAAIDTLVIDWTSVKPRPVVSGGTWTKTLKPFRAALDRSLADGVLVRTVTEGPTVKVAPRSAVRTEFNKGRADKTPDANRKAFNRSIDDALKAGLILSCEVAINGIEQSVIWLADAATDGGNA